MKFLKPINDGKSINDKRVFILETEETIFDVSVKHYLIDEGDCLRLHYQVDDSKKLEKTRYSVTSGDYLNDLGFNVIHNEEDFYENNRGDIVVSNPPFSDKKKIILRLIELDKPFILIIPQNAINNNYIKDLLQDKQFQILIPRRRIQFIKNGNETQNKCNFDCFYYCYKMNFKKDIIFL